MANSRQEKIARYKEQKEQERRLKVAENFSSHNYLESFSVTWNWWNKEEFFPVFRVEVMNFAFKKDQNYRNRFLSIFQALHIYWKLRYCTLMVYYFCCSRHLRSMLKIFLDQRNTVCSWLSTFCFWRNSSHLSAIHQKLL